MGDGGEGGDRIDILQGYLNKLFYFSNVSANLNTLAGTMYEDFFSACLSEKSKEAKANFTMKLTVAVTGCLCVLMVYLVEHMGAILQVGYSKNVTN